MHYFLVFSYRNTAAIFPAPEVFVVAGVGAVRLVLAVEAIPEPVAQPTAQYARSRRALELVLAAQFRLRAGRRHRYGNWGSIFSSLATLLVATVTAVV